MSRKHYIAAAAVIRRRVDWLYRDRAPLGGQIIMDTLEVLTRDTADLFAADNGRFDRARFYRAAGFEELAVVAEAAEQDRAEMREQNRDRFL